MAMGLDSPWYWRLLAPAVGGLVVGPLVYFLAPEAKGHGVPEVMESVARRGGVIRARVVAIKTLASAICIGSGGSVGREGPIVQIGSTIGSAVGQAMRLSDDRVRNLVACGAAGGVAATFQLMEVLARPSVGKVAVPSMSRLDAISWGMPQSAMSM